MDWTQTIVILGVFAAFFVYLLNRLDRLKQEFRVEMGDFEKKIEAKMDKLEEKIETEMGKIEEKLETEMGKIEMKIESLQKEVSMVYSKISNIEGQITQMTRPKIVPLDQHDAEEN